MKIRFKDKIYMFKRNSRIQQGIFVKNQISKLMKDPKFQDKLDVM